MLEARDDVIFHSKFLTNIYLINTCLGEWKTQINDAIPNNTNKTCNAVSPAFFIPKNISKRIVEKNWHKQFRSLHFTFLQIRCFITYLPFVVLLLFLNSFSQSQLLKKEDFYYHQQLDPLKYFLLEIKFRKFILLSYYGSHYLLCKRG